MSKNFAKLFAREGNQVLVRLHESDPALVVTFKDDEDSFYITPTIEFKPQSDAPEAVEKAWERADKAFSRVTEEWAFDMREKTLAGIVAYGDKS